MPESFGQAVDWVESNMGKVSTGSIMGEGVSRNESLNQITKKGFFNSDAAIKRPDGSLLSSDQKAAIEGASKEGNTTRIVDKMGPDSNYAGHYMIIDKEGNRFFMEPSDTKTLKSASFMHVQVLNALSSPGGRSSVTFRTDLVLGGGKDARIPAGTYETRHQYNKNAGPRGGKKVVLYQGGKPMYVSTGQKDRNGKPEYQKL